MSPVVGVTVESVVIVCYTSYRRGSTGSLGVTSSLLGVVLERCFKGTLLSAALALVGIDELHLLQNFHYSSPIVASSVVSVTGTL